MVAKIIPEERKCLVCPNTFLVGGSGNKRKETKYCSWSCRSAAKVNSNSGSVAVMAVSDAAYLAGFIDADGHIGLYERKNKDSVTVGLIVEATNTDRTVLEWIALVTGVGGVYARFKGSDIRKPTYCWRASGDLASGVLQQVLPYLKVKRDRAELGIEFRTKMKDPMLKARRDWQYTYREQMLAMNKRGPKDKESN